MSAPAYGRGSAGWLAMRLAGPGIGRPAWRTGGRMAFALSAPLAVGLATGYAQLGMIAALSAFMTALAEPAGGARAHATTYAWLALAQGFVGLLGALTAGTVIAAGIVGLAVGIATGAIVGSSSRLAVAGPFPLLLFVVVQGVVPSLGAWPTALAALLGGLWVAVSSLILVPVAPFLPLEITASESWRAIAALAGNPSDPRRQLMATGALEQLRADLIATPGRSQAWARRRRELWGAGEAGQRVMVGLVALAPKLSGANGTALRDLLAATQRAADDIARATIRGRRPQTDLDAVLARVVEAEPVGVSRTAARMVARIGDAAMCLDGSIAPGATAIPDPERRAVLRPLLAGLRWGSLGLRHGMRLGIAAGGCMAVFGLLGERLPLVTNHAPWVTITLVDVLAPSVGASVQRILQRTAGTGLGAIASALAIWLVGGPWALAAVAVVAGVTAAVIRPINYAWFMALFTPLVLLIASTATPLGPEAALGRMTATVVGCVLGLIIALYAWPIRLGDTAPRALATAIRALADDVAGALRVARAGGSPREMTAAHQRALTRAGDALELLEGAAIESLTRRTRPDPLAAVAGATVALADQAADVGTRMPEHAIVVPGTLDAAIRMEHVLRTTADCIDAHRPAPDPGDLSAMLEPARDALHAHPDPVAESLLDAFDGMLRATRAVAITAADWARATATAPEAITLQGRR